MKFTMIRRTSVAVLATALSLATFATPAAAAPPDLVDFTVREALPIGTPGVVTDSNVPGCDSGTVTTTAVDAIERNRRTTFVGTKIVDCGEGDTFTVAFRATGVECAATNSGRWTLVAGTGAFEDATGRGQLVGSYVAADGTPGNFCDNAGVDDQYTGRIRLAS